MESNPCDIWIIIAHVVLLCYQASLPAVENYQAFPTSLPITIVRLFIEQTPRPDVIKPFFKAKNWGYSTKGFTLVICDVT